MKLRGRHGACGAQEATRRPSAARTGSPVRLLGALALLLVGTELERGVSGQEWATEYPRVIYHEQDRSVGGGAGGRSGASGRLQAAPGWSARPVSAGALAHGRNDLLQPPAPAAPAPAPPAPPDAAACAPCAAGRFRCGDCACVPLARRCDGAADCAGGEDEARCAPPCDEADGRLQCPHTAACISKEWLCDGDNDCGDYSDESRCVGEAVNCTSDQFECDNGLCIHRSWVCDSDNDCKDNSDEKNCSAVGCAANQFQCGNGQCVSLHWKCDKDSDCLDLTDETDCPVELLTCGDGEFHCANRRCIRDDFQCDGDNDCEDWSDEDECPLLPSSCGTGEFKCRDDKCIPLRWRCDRETDCTEGDDEDNCGVTDMRTCSGDEYTCSDSKCILRTWVCDGVADCFNGEDELKCEVSCEEDQYMCKPYSNRTIISSAFSTCVNKKHVCDGLKDCPRGDDEDKCPTKRDCEANSPCEKLCITTADGHEACACPAGYVLGDDTYSCRDIDECMYEQDPVCSQTCSNTIGSFTCGCMTGYVLRPDLRSCKAIGASPTLLFSNRLEIREVSLSSDRYTSVLKGLRNAVALDYHYEKQLIFWSEIILDVIRVAYVNGTNATDIIKWGLQAPSGVAVDWIHDLLFWTDSGTRRVEVATLDGKKRAVVAASDLDKPRAIAVHPGDALVFWTDWGPSPKIERSDMDGSNRKSVVISDIFWPNGLTIDYTSGKIYWADAKHHIIECANFDGRLRKKVTSKGLPHPYALTLFEDAIYWTDWHTKSISTVNKNTGVGFQTIHAGLNVPMDIHSFHPQRQPPYKDHCSENNGGCSYLCLPNYSSHSCHCPKGHNLKADGRTCEISPEKLLVFARKKDIRIQQLNPLKKDLDIDMVIPLDGIKSAVALAWDHETNSIFWTDVDKDTINRAYLNGSNQHLVVSTNLMSPAGVAFDWITKKLYWSDAGTNRIEVANVDGSMRALLAWENIDKPRDIVVDPTNGVMYWSDWGESPCIESAYMDGDNRHRIVSTNITWPNGLALDLERGRIYWSDGGTRSIEHSKLDGTDRQILISTDLPHPFGLDLYGNEVFWTDWDTSSIQAANKLTGTNRRELGSGITGLMDVRVFHKERRAGLNRCGLNNGGCSHLCLLKPGGYSCYCPIGIKLGIDGKTCANGPKNFLIIAHRMDIRIVSLDMPYLVDVVVPLPPLKSAVGVDVDRNTGYIYWTDTMEGVIKRGSRGGKNISTVIDSGIRHVEGLILDSIGRKIYWTDSGRKSIEVAELDGRNRKILIWTNLDSPRGIVLHYRRGYMYWTDWGKNPRIERAGMDGSKVIIKDNLIWPNGLAIDQAEDRLYWNDAKRSIIESSDLDGKDRRTLSTDAASPYGLVIVDSYVYWTDWMSKALHRADKVNGSNSIIVRDKLEGLMDIRAVQIEQNPQNLPDNICSKSNGGCSHLCLRTPNGYSCACPTGIAFNLPQDAADRLTTCKSHPSTFLIFATGTSLGMISMEAPELWDVTLPLTDINNSIAVDFHWEHKLIFYTDVSLNVIRRVNMLNMTQTKTVISGNVYTPNGLGVDWIANNIYWTDNEHKVLEVARLDGSSRKILINDMDEPRSLVLYPKKGYIYWTDWGENPRIERAFLDGSDRKSIIDSDLGFPNGLAIDYREKRLYWTDALKDRIDTSDLHGNKRVQLIPDAKHPFGLTQLGEYLYWTDWHNKSIIRSHKSSGVSEKIIRTDLKLVMEIKAVSPEKQKGWNQCKENNGGCSHLCFFLGTNYTCACPDVPDRRPCSEVPAKWVTVTKHDEEDDYPDTDDENEVSGDSIKKQTKNGGGPSTSSTDVTMYLTYTMAIFVKIMVVVAFLYFLYVCLRRRSKHLISDNYEDGPEGGRVISFPNPNYNANGGGSVQIEPERRRNTRFLIFRYDRTQDRVTNVYPPEGASLIPPIHSMGSHTPPSAHKDGQLAHSLRHHDDFDTVTLHPMG